MCASVPAHTGTICDRWRAGTARLFNPCNEASRRARLLGFDHARRTDSFGARVARYGGLAFFLHAAHFPLLAEVKILLWDLVPEPTDSWMIAHYAVSVAATVVIGVSVGILLARWKPHWFAMLNGGRLLG